MIYALNHTNHRATERAIHLFGRAWHGALGSLETDLRMGAVAERFGGRRAAAAKRHPLFRGINIPVIIFQFRLPRHNVGPVLNNLDSYVSHDGNLVQRKIAATVSVS
jgi:hypothetical protein